jgi:microcystin degradation protein MlrC
MGPSVLVVTDGDQERAQAEANRLADKLFAARKQLVAELPDASQAVARAMHATKHPVVLVEFGDNIGGGSPGDSTVILGELLRQGATGTATVIYDPESVQQAVAAGIGNYVELTVGGKTDDLHGPPIGLSGRVLSVHDGRWTEEQPRHGGRRFNDQGQTVVLEIDPNETGVAQRGAATPGQLLNAQEAGGAPQEVNSKSLLVLNSKRTPPFSLGQLTSLGIEPSRLRAIVVKAAIAYRAAYGPIAGEIIEVDTPGLTANDPRRFRYTRVRRPLYPLDDI